MTHGTDQNLFIATKGLSSSFRRFSPYPVARMRDRKIQCYEGEGKGIDNHYETIWLEKTIESKRR